MSLKRDFTRYQKYSIPRASREENSQWGNGQCSLIETSSGGICTVTIRWKRWNNLIQENVNFFGWEDRLRAFTWRHGTSSKTDSASIREEYKECCDIWTNSSNFRFCSDLNAKFALQFDEVRYQWYPSDILSPVRVTEGDWSWIFFCHLCSEHPPRILQLNQDISVSLFRSRCETSQTSRSRPSHQKPYRTSHSLIWLSFFSLRPHKNISRRRKSDIRGSRAMSFQFRLAHQMPRFVQPSIVGQIISKMTACQRIYEWLWGTYAWWQWFLKYVHIYKSPDHIVEAHHISESKMAHLKR
jgi:hypothetical protein